MLSAALSGFLFKRLGPVKRIILALAGIGLLIPIGDDADILTLLANIAGGGVALLLVIMEWQGRSKE